MKVQPMLPRRIFRAAVLVGSVTLAAFASGCSDTSAPLISEEPTASVDDTVPPMSELAVEVGLTEAQIQEIEPALEEWRRSMAQSEMSEDFLLEDSPAVTFLSRVAGVVDRDQLDAVVRMAQRSVEARDASLRPDPADRGVHLSRGIRGLFRGLDLTDEQIAALREALAVAHEDAAALCDDFKDGIITEEELLAGRLEIRAALDAAIADILTDKQNDQLEQNKLDVMAHRLMRLLDRFEARVDRRVKRLDALLDLTDDQEVAIRDAMTSARPDLEALLSDVEAAAVSSDEARDEFHSIRQGVNDAVRAELTDEQVGILDALRDMNVPCGRTLHD